MIEVDEKVIRSIYDKALASQPVNDVEFKVDGFTMSVSDADEDGDVRIFNIYIVFEDKKLNEHTTTPSDIIGLDKKRTGYDYFKEKFNRRVNELLEYGKDVVKWKRKFL